MEEIDLFFTKANSFSWIDVTGGEIVLRPDIMEVAAVILKHCRHLSLLHFTTNGSLVDETVEMTREIMTLGPQRLVITVSLDGPPDVHDRIRGMETSYDKAVETFLRLREQKGCTVYLGMTLSGENEGLYDKTLDSLRERIPEIGPKDLHVNIAHKSDHYYKNTGLEQSCETVLHADITHIRNRRNKGWLPMDLLERAYLGFGEKYLESGQSPLSCMALNATCFVHSTGLVYPCVTWDRPLGDLRKSGYDLGRIWRSLEAVRALKEIRTTSCPGCWTPCEAVPAMAGKPITTLLKGRPLKSGASSLFEELKPVPETSAISCKTDTAID